MCEPNLRRDVYDLCYSRLRVIDRTWRHIGWTEQQVADSRSRRRALDLLSMELLVILERRDALVFCQHFLTCFIEAWPMSDSPNINNLPSATAPSPSRPDTEDEVTELRARLSAAKRDIFLEYVLAQNVKQLCKDIRIRNMSSFLYKGPRFLYRVYRLKSHTFYSENVGFCCPRWLRQRRFDEPSIQDFYHHANQWSSRIIRRSIRDAIYFHDIKPQTCAESCDKR